MASDSLVSADAPKEFFLQTALLELFSGEHDGLIRKQITEMSEEEQYRMAHGILHVEVARSETLVPPEIRKRWETQTLPVREQAWRIQGQRDDEMIEQWEKTLARQIDEQARREEQRDNEAFGRMI